MSSPGSGNSHSKHIARFWLHKNSLRHVLNVKVPGSDPYRRNPQQGREDPVALCDGLGGGSLRVPTGSFQEPVKAQDAQTRTQGLERITSTQERNAAACAPRRRSAPGWAAPSGGVRPGQGARCPGARAGEVSQLPQGLEVPSGH